MKLIYVLAILTAACSVKAPAVGLANPPDDPKNHPAMGVADGVGLKPVTTDTLFAFADSGSCRVWQYVPLQFHSLPNGQTDIQRRQDIYNGQVVAYSDVKFIAQPEVSDQNLRDLRAQIATEIANTPNCLVKTTASQLELGAAELTDANTESLGLLHPKGELYDSRATGFAPDRIEWRLSYDGTAPDSQKQIMALIDATHSGEQEVGKLRIQFDGYESEIQILAKNVSLGRSSLAGDATSVCMQSAYDAQVTLYPKLKGKQPMPVNLACLGQPARPKTDKN